VRRIPLKVITCFFMGAVVVLVGPGTSSALSAKPRAASDLRIRISGWPGETRVGNEVNYALTVSNVGLSAAKDVVVRVTGGHAGLIEVSAGGQSCAPPSQFEAWFALGCSFSSLAPHAAKRIELGVRPSELGRIVVHATVESRSQESRLRNNAASVSTPVFSPDSVHVAATRVGPNTMNLTIDAISSRHGRDPDGTFALDWEGKASGHVTCLNVSGNKALVGVVVDSPAVDVAADATPTPYLLFILTDNGSPGPGRDTVTFARGADPFSCEARSFPGSGYTITSGDIAIVDTR
jgi:Domain of unknown function DUF11